MFRVRIHLRFQVRMVLFENYGIVVFGVVGRMMSVDRMMDIMGIVVIDNTFVDTNLYMDRCMGLKTD